MKYKYKLYNLFLSYYILNTIFSADVNAKISHSKNMSFYYNLNSATTKNNKIYLLDNQLMLLFLIIILLIVLIYMWLNIKKRKEIEEDLKRSNEELTALYEQLEASDEELRRQFDEIQLHEIKLAESEERYKLVFNASHEGLWDINLETNEMYITEEWHGRFFNDKITNNDMTIDKWYSLIHPDDVGKLMNLREKLNKGNIDRFSCEYRVMTPQKDYIWIYENTIALRDEEGNLKRVAGSHSNINYRKLHEEKIEYMAYHDTLTGLPNRMALKNKLNKILSGSLPNIHNGALMFLDVDNFKFINDTYGHGVGDEVLREIGYRLKSIENDNTFVGRLGGDEFIIIANDINDIEQIKNLASYIQDIFKNKFAVYDREIFLSTSIGIVLYPENGTKIDELLKNADSAMYKSKLYGRNRYMLFNKKMNEEKSDRVYIQNTIRDAIDNERFSLHYQPEIDVKTGRIVGFEALIRWIDKDYGYIQPEKFIRIAEEMGLIISIGNWVIKKACIFSKRINENSNSKCVVSVNVSTVQLIQDDFIDTVKGIIKEVDVNPSYLGIEITETSMMESFQTNAYKIKQLKKLGIKTSLDDFGTGYSSLNYLRQLPINTLKIDKSFIDDLATDIYGTNLTEGIIMIAHKIGLSVVAEGVETYEQIEQLKKCQCDIIQGYYISKPLTEDKAIDFIENSQYSCLD